MVGAVTKDLKRGHYRNKIFRKHKDLDHSEVNSLTVDKCGNLYFVKDKIPYFPTNLHNCMTTFSFRNNNEISTFNPGEFLKEKLISKRTKEGKNSGTELAMMQDKTIDLYSFGDLAWVNN